MNKWSPDAQINSLKYGAYTTLLGSLMFGVMLAEKVAGQWQLSGHGVFSVMVVLVAFAFMFVVFRWSWISRSLNGTGWREAFSLYTDEFSRDIYHKANSKSFLAAILLIALAFVLSELTPKLGESLQQILTLGNYALLVLFVCGVLWSSVILYQLRDEVA